MAEFKTKFQKLNNNNYSSWKYRMELLLIKEDLWEGIIKIADDDEDCDGSSSTGTIVSATKLIKMDNKAKALIGLHVEDDQLVYIRKKTSAIECWNALKEHHEKHTLSNKVHIMRKICNLKLEENGNVQKHVNQMMELFQKLSDISEEEQSESWNVAMLLSSLSAEYDNLITALEGRLETELTFAFVIQKVIAEYERRIKKINHEIPTAMVATSKGFTCHFCKKEGHFKKDCGKYKRWLSKQYEKEHEANLVRISEEDQFAL